jgi:hypothetical protein
MMVDDRTPFLSRDAERVLSVLPDDYATDVKKICIVARMSVSKVTGLLEELIFQSLVKVVQGLDSSTTYWITSAGLEHPQRASDGNRARAPRLPVAVRPRSRRAVDYSRQWITADQGCDGATRDPPSINERAVPVSKAQAADIAKTSNDLHAPYSLTDDGRATSTDGTTRRVVKAQVRPRSSRS